MHRRYILVHLVGEMEFLKQHFIAVLKETSAVQRERPMGKHMPIKIH